MKHTCETTPRNTKLVLVAEDDDALRDAIMSLLHQLGLHTLGAANGAEMLSIVEPLLLLEDHGRCPDLILTDLIMPGIEPLEIVEGLTSVGPRVPIVVISGVEDGNVRDRVATLGVPWLDKPVRAAQLERTILSVLPETYARIAWSD